MTKSPETDEQKPGGSIWLVERVLASTALAAAAVMFVGYMAFAAFFAYVFGYTGPVFSLVTPDAVLMQGATLMFYYFGDKFLLGAAVSYLALRLLSPRQFRIASYVCGSALVLLPPWFSISAVTTSAGAQTPLLFLRRHDAVANHLLLLAACLATTALLANRIPFAADGKIKAFLILATSSLLFVLAPLLVPREEFSVSRVTVRVEGHREERLLYLGLKDGFFALGDLQLQRIVLVPERRVTEVVLGRSPQNFAMDLKGYCKAHFGSEDIRNVGGTPTGWRCMPADAPINGDQLCLEQHGLGSTAIADLSQGLVGWHCRK